MRGKNIIYWILSQELFLFIIAPTFDPSKRRHSESILPNITKREPRVGRKFSLIDRKDINEINHKTSIQQKAHLQEVAEQGDIRIEQCPSRLPRIPSVTPEPEIIRMEGQKSEKNASPVLKLPEVEPSPSYRPKYCWCLRCQLMFTMFRTGDPHLENWGNYPCFQR